MLVVRTKSQLTKNLALWRNQGQTIGFVPTMGALHEGHISLVKRALQENHHVLVSLFVNPTQFNEASDYQAYPKSEAADIRMLEEAGADLVFIPEVAEMYGKENDSYLDFDFEGFDLSMEGAFRPGHFRGVVEIVDKLFLLAQANRAYFGQKDFQQLAIVRLLARKRHPATEIVACPIVRENSGLAMSSRNRLLSEDERLRASSISRALFTLKEQWGKLPLDILKEEAWDTLKTAGEPEYLEIVHRDSLLPVRNTDSIPAVACTAVRVGKIRLIDNVELP